MSQKPQSPDNQLTNIFINYRRADTSGHAGRLERDLSKRFPGRVFMDIHNIEVGKDFTEAINDEVGRCGALIVMIGNQWLDITDPKTGKRRLDNPDDFVALEIAGALKRDTRVIPVLVEGATMPQEDDLPTALAGLARRNAIEITDTRWDYDTEQLIKVLEKICGSSPQPAEDTSKAGRAVASNVPTAKSGVMKIAIISIVATLVAVVALVAFLSSLDDAPPQPNVNNTNIGGQTSANVATPDSVPKPSDAIKLPPPQAVVKPSVVEIVIPVDSNRKWEWGG
ncbi:MAG TPA: toll/interleukin-1 receptor domain-containing protein, partial [Pyrinomonadaceae bacterium]|nr:toll/interleukin-1 receptor domain-containing protein [Pyrinomonadaceae bacterium]